MAGIGEDAKARAGDAGKGFAVVAEEVRNLAQRSAAAAKETADKIEHSRQLAGDGVKIAHDVAGLLDQVKGHVVKAAALAGEISAAGQEQSKGLGELNQAMAQLDQTTQQSSAVSEEAAAASEELLGQVEMMEGVVRELEAVTLGTVQPHAEERPAPVAVPAPKAKAEEPQHHAPAQLV